MKIECIRGGAVRILLALMLGLLVVSGYVVAPILFAKAGSAHEAGRLAGEIFHVVNLGALLLAVAVGSFWLRMPGRSKITWSLLALFILLIAVNEFAVSPVIAGIKEVVGPIDLLPEGDPQRSRFGMWHGISALIHLLSSVTAVALLLSGSHGHAGCRKEKETA